MSWPVILLVCLAVVVLLNAAVIAWNSYVIAMAIGFLLSHLGRR